MISRLERVRDWSQLAAKARYDPAIIANHCMVSLRQLERFFRNRFGKTPHLWAKELQCEHARILLSRGYSNKTVTTELGFTNAAEFCRIFKKFYTVSPQRFSSNLRAKVALSQEC